MTDRFASLKSDKNTNRFQKDPPKKKNSRFDSLSSDNSSNNRFESNTFKRKPFDRNNRRRNNRDISNNKTSLPNQIGKFTQVCKGEVAFMPHFQSKNMSQKERKKEMKMAKLKVIDKKEDNDDWNSLQNDEDIALTLAMAQKYQYYTESEEEEENDEEEITDNSAW